MKVKLMQQCVDHLNKIEKLLNDEQFDSILELLDQNEQLILQIQNLKEDETLSSNTEIEIIKQQFISKNQQLTTQLQTIMGQRKVEFKQMSQKVQASQVYNNMQRNLY